MALSDNAVAIYRNLYMSTDESDPTHVHDRVATAISKSPEEKAAFFEVLENNVFRPNTPCMINARVKGDSNTNDHDNNLVACFVLDLDDTMESIMDMWSTCAKIYAGGGGAGLPLSNLREKDSLISTGGQASGPIKYLEVVQSISETVKSGGKSRRAANLASFRYNHPDIVEYIKCKEGEKFSAVNISVLVNDWFMKQVSEKNFSQEYDLVSPNEGKVISKVTVGEIWNMIIEQAWKSGDPGMLFYDETNKRNALPSTGEVVCTNPCGEVALPPNSCCDLGSLNLNKFLIETDGKYEFDWLKYKEAIQIATIFLDNVIDKTTFPTENFKNRMTSERPIGLGLMGFSDILYKMKIPYGSKESIDLFEEICKALTKHSFEYSIERCNDRNCAPIKIAKEDHEHFVNRLRHFGVDDSHIEMFERTGIRNGTTTSIAPTGSISISAECSYAFEPTFALIWSKPLVDRDETLFFVNSEFEKACAEAGVKLTREIKDKISANKGSCNGIAEIPKDIQKVFVTAHDVGWRKKVEMQAAGQRWITLAISSTCNLPSEATKEDVAEAYVLAWKKNLKGITVFRDGCLSFQPVNFGGTDQTADPEDLPDLTPMRRPTVRSGKTIEFNTPHGKVYMTGNMTKKDRVFELFINMGQQGHVTNIMLDALGKVMSKALQYGVPVDALIDTMANCGGMSFFFKLDDEAERSEQAQSLVDAIAKVIDHHFNNGQNNVCESTHNTSLAKCPQCGNYTLVMGAGCRGGSCADPDCGYSVCG